MTLPCCLLCGRENRAECLYTRLETFLSDTYHKISICALSCQGVWRAFLKPDLAVSLCCLNPVNPTGFLCVLPPSASQLLLLAEGRRKVGEGIQQKVRHLEGSVGSFRSKAVPRGGVQRGNTHEHMTTHRAHRFILLFARQPFSTLGQGPARMYLIQNRTVIITAADAYRTLAPVLRHSLKHLTCICSFTFPPTLEVGSGTPSVQSTRETEAQRR